MYRRFRHRVRVVLSGLALIAASELPAASVQELERACEQARQEKLAPRRESMIGECVAKGNNADYCRRYYRDYGEGGSTLHGMRRKGLHYDLPVCREAGQARLDRDREVRGSTTGSRDRSDSTGTRDRSSEDRVNRGR